MTGQCPECHKYITIQAEDKIVNAVIGKFNLRSNVGIKKYGTTLMRDDLTRLEWLTHLQDELMDAILYCERLKLEMHDKHENMY